LYFNCSCAICLFIAATFAPLTAFSSKNLPTALAPLAILSVKFSTPVPACNTPLLTFLKSRFIIPSKITPNAVNLFIKFPLTNSYSSDNAFFGFEKAETNFSPNPEAIVKIPLNTAFNGSKTAVNLSAPACVFDK